MNLNPNKWKSFKLFELFMVKYGINLELNACEETSKYDPHKINFVSRSRENNGVTAYVKPIKGLKPQDAGIITVAGGGSSVLSTFVQDEPFYSGRDLYLLIPLPQYKSMSYESKQFICTVIMMNKYRYSFGRQANKTLQYLEIMLPAVNNSPDWKYLDDYIKTLNYKSLTTTNKSRCMDIDVQQWKEFSLKALFGECIRGTRITKENRITGQYPFVTAGEFNEGVSELINNSEAQIYSNALTIDMFGNCFYRNYEFKCDDNILVFTNSYINKYTGLFIASVISVDKYRNSYGRQYRQKDYYNHRIMLPSTSSNQPDWKFMEKYISNLPYGDKL